MTTCPSCTKELPGEFPFCPFCGAAISPSGAAVAVRERKIVSVVFCDRVGSTAAAEAADPEEVQARMAPYPDELLGVQRVSAGPLEQHPLRRGGQHRLLQQRGHERRGVGIREG
jgi:hypothetical protein